MKRVRIFAARLRGLFGGQSREAELGEEVRAHLEMAAQEHMRRGMSAEDARYAAWREFGGVEQVKETYRERRGLPMIETFLQDLRFGVRMLRKNPGFTAIAVLTLALGIGATTAIFSVVDAVLLQPLLYKDPSALVLIQERIAKVAPFPFEVSAPDIFVMQRENRVFEDVAGFLGMRVNLAGVVQPERVQTARIAADLLPLLGATPLLGRTFTSEEDRSATPVALLSYALWQRNFGGNPDVLGRGITLDGQSYTVIGVMPRTFEFPPRGMPHNEPADLWIPISFSKKELADVRDNFDYSVLARLKPGVSIEQARADMVLVAEAIQKTWGPEALIGGFKIETAEPPFREVVVSKVRALLFLLLGAVGLLLLIACANVANLLLARAARRQKEITIRAALGAGRGRITRQLATESALLGLLGGGVGVLLSVWGTHLLSAAAPANIPQVQGIHLNPAVLAFSAALSLLTGLIFGLAPALSATRADVMETLKEGGRGESAGRHGAKIRNFFVVAEVAIAFVLVIGAGLLIRSFIRVVNTDSGARVENVLTAVIALPSAQYSDSNRVTGFFQHFFGQMKNTPGVESIGASSDLPTEANWNHIFSVEEHPTPSSTALPLSSHTLVLGDYFETLGIPLVRGRFFTADEEQGKDQVLMVSSEMAKHYWPGEDPIGKRIKWGPAEGNNPWLTIVGVVGDVKQGDLDKPTEAHTYAPYRQDCSGSLGGTSLCQAMSIMARAAIPSTTLAAELRSAVQKLDAAQPLTRVRTLKEVVESSAKPHQFNAFLLAIFSGAALFLAAIGLYGVLAYVVAQQTHDIGIRMALGAQEGDVLRLVLRQGLKLCTLGIAIGLIGALSLTGLIRSLLYGVSGTDPLTYTAAAVLLSLVALTACYIPGRRAMRVDPMVALRHE